jgi:ADP-ribose pyrophosphatase
VFNHFGNRSLLFTIKSVPYIAGTDGCNSACRGGDEKPPWPESQELILQQEELLQTPRFCVQRVKRQLPDGRVKQREIVRHAGSVVIIPSIDDQTVCLIRNYRMAIDSPLIELPAGTREPNEAPLQCAERELAEETGYRAGKLEKLTSFFAAPGILDEEMHLFLATDLTPGPPCREADEEIENLIVRWEEALRMIHCGEIRDAKTIAGLLFHQRWPRR